MCLAGLWDVCSSEEAVAMSHDMLASGSHVTKISQQLVTLALQGGSTDNVTVCVLLCEAVAL